ncbi:hypothetical protein [Streptomyces sp. NPDC058206]|uniref:hypothetical protein n=1 Tax=Streptomyces sp. NPDC058206 TaxID=3346382 RepID=UPI0036E656BF
MAHDFSWCGVFVAPDLELGAHPVLMSALGVSGSIRRALDAGPPPPARSAFGRGDTRSSFESRVRLDEAAGVVGTGDQPRARLMVVASQCWWPWS